MFNLISNHFHATSSRKNLQGVPDFLQGVQKNLQALQNFALRIRTFLFFHTNIPCKPSETKKPLFILSFSTLAVPLPIVEETEFLYQNSTMVRPFSQQ